MDETGQPYVSTGDDNLYHAWYRPGPDGLTFLFDDVDYALPYEGTDVSWDELETTIWRQYIEENLHANGYVGDVWIDWPGEEFYFTDIVTWPQLEKQLIDSFCGYARELGQMK